MESTKISRVFFLVFFHSTLFVSVYFSFSDCVKRGLETDKLALLAFKSQLTDDPFGALSTWNDSLHVCRWLGVTCSTRHQRVAALDLHSRNLTGSISPCIGNLTFLSSINLQQNSFKGEIPQEIGRLFRLRFISFRENKLQGEIPINLTRCSELRVIEFGMNKLTGRIPAELGNLPKLTGLGLANNKLTGSIPPSLGNLSSLEALSLLENSLSGSIPVELGHLKKLTMFQISVNYLTGPIPTQLFNITSMKYFMVSDNQLVGEIPPDIGFNMPNLSWLLLGRNRFTGPIPHSISNASSLEHLDFVLNHFTGSIPVNLRGLKNLIWLNFAVNNLGTRQGDDLRFIDSLVNCTSLERLGLSNNSLKGVLPGSIANLSSSLSFLTMGANKISGNIPADIGNLRGLMVLGIEDNLLTGSIPVSAGYLANLSLLSIFGNRLSGEIPSSLGNLTLLTELSLDNNALHGKIPSSLGNCQHLQGIGLSANNLSGSIPTEILRISFLSRWLDLSQNQLTGPVQVEVGNLRNLEILDLGDNKFSGEIPNSLGQCVSLDHLSLRGNSFQGPIPSSLSALRGLEDLDLSENNFSGEIPDFLGTFLFLKTLNLSFNNLEGEVPQEGIFRNASGVAITGNEKLCGGAPQLHLDNCLSKDTKKTGHRRLFLIIILSLFLAACLLLACLVTILCWRRNVKRKASAKNTSSRKYLRVSYAELLNSTDGFSSANLIGTGGYGSVYKGNLGVEETAIAVKVLNLQQSGASKSFTAECEALRGIRHRNLVRVITSCSSVDYKGNEFKAIVYEFMPNGSLDNWLHEPDGQNPRPNLTLEQRLSIAIDVAQALDYLHHRCHTTVVHCDLKPSNVLLDDEMVAHVGDFGLSRLLYYKNSQNQASSSRLKGSIGYVAPEYGVTGKVSTDGDIYSYGILLLEIFSGRRPTDNIFGDRLSLRSFVEAAIPDGVLEIAESMIVEEALHVHQGTNNKKSLEKSRNKLHEILASVLKIGIRCSAELPRERMETKDIIKELQELRDMVSVSSP